MNYYPPAMAELSAMSSGWHFTCQRLAGPALALAAWLQGPHSNCARTETLFSSTARGLRPSPSVQHPPQGSPCPHPGARASLLHGSTQRGLDRVIPKSSFPGPFKPGILLTGKATVPKMSHPNLSCFLHEALTDSNSCCSWNKLLVEGARALGARQPLV